MNIDQIDPYLPSYYERISQFVSQVGVGVQMLDWSVNLENWRDSEETFNHCYAVIHDDIILGVAFLFFSAEEGCMFLSLHPGYAWNKLIEEFFHILESVMISSGCRIYGVPYYDNKGRKFRWFRKLLAKVGFDPDTEIPIYTDDKGFTKKLGD